MLPVVLGAIALLPVRVQAQPTITPDAAVMNLDELGAYAVGYAYRGQPEQQLPLGWSGPSEASTGVGCEPLGEQQGRRAFYMKPPGGAGIAFQQFVFALPAQATGVFLRGATAMLSDSIGVSDGVIFRVFINGQKLLETYRTNDVWEDFEFDLTLLRGGNATIRFEVDPGPYDNTACDWALWGARDLVIEGYTPIPPVHPPPPALVLSNVWSRPNGEVAPLGGFTGASSVWLSNDVAHLRYAGADGTMEYVWQRPQSANDGVFGTLTLAAQMTGDAPVTVPLARFANLSWTASATAGDNSWQPGTNSVTLVRSFTVGTTRASVQITGNLVGKSLVLSVTCDQPLVTSFGAGWWGPVERCQQVTVPYYSGLINFPPADQDDASCGEEPLYYSGLIYFFPEENIFVNAFLDWTASAASSHWQTRASYDPLTDGTRSRLQERAVFSAAWHMAEVLPNIPNPPSPWIGFLANKVVSDNWGGGFNYIAQGLTDLAGYGITNYVAIIHDWQRNGSDLALPSHYPANASYGGDAGLSNVVATGNRIGILVALHESYVDYYPKYEFFDTNDIALDSSGSLQLAWYDAGTGIQSFAIKPNAILRLAATQSPEIHRRYGTRASYLDVHSCGPPWSHVDFRAGEAGAGQFARVWQVYRELWSYERGTYEGPVFGEGNRHWYWSGLLDGVDARFGCGWANDQGMTAPLNVDFDLLKIHPLQFNYGMGGGYGWWPQGQETNRDQTYVAPMIELDQYRVQEVAYGHACYIWLGRGDNVNRRLGWHEHHLLSPVTARYATARPVEIQYEINGHWLDTTAAIKAGNDKTNNRVRVTYDNGLVISANGASNTMLLDPWRLPQFGWLASGAGIVAGTVLRDGVVADFADTGDTLFVNARSDGDWNQPGLHRVHPSVSSFQQTGLRTFRVTHQWQVGEQLPRDYVCYSHFALHLGTNGVGLYLQDHSVTPPTSQWQAGQTLFEGPYTINIPMSTMPDGDYDWFISLYNRNTGDGVRLLGTSQDGGLSILLGVLHVRNNGMLLTFDADQTGAAPDPWPVYHEHMNSNGTVVDFGDVRTDGSARLRYASNEWVLQTWPRDRAFTLELSAQRFDQPAQVRCVGGATSEVTPVPVAGGARWRLPLNDATEYRWTASNGAGPRLDIIPAGEFVILRWPAWSEGFVLRSAPNLTPVVSWSIVTNLPALTDGYFAVSIQPATGTRFYQLQHP